MLHEVTVRVSKFMKFKIESATVEDANDFAIREAKKHFPHAELVEFHEVETPVQE